MLLRLPSRFSVLGIVLLFVLVVHFFLLVGFNQNLAWIVLGFFWTRMGNLGGKAVLHLGESIRKGEKVLF
jgi:hypothetical protein